MQCQRKRYQSPWRFDDSDGQLKVPRVGLEPTLFAEPDFESGAGMTIARIRKGIAFDSAKLSDIIDALIQAKQHV